VRQAARLIVEEALEGEAADALGRGYYEHGAERRGYRNGNRLGKVRTAQGEIEFAVPQLSDMAQPFRSRIRELLRGRTEELERLAIEMYARGLSVRDIEAAFTDEAGRCLLSRTAASELTERLWADYQGFASRDLAEFKVLYLFVDGVAEKLHLGQPREAVLAASGITETGHKVLLGPGAGNEGGHFELPGLPEGSEGPRSCRSDSWLDRWCAGADPRVRRGVPAQLSTALPCPQDAQPAEQGARGDVARIEGHGARRLPGRKPEARADGERGLRRALRARLSERHEVLPGRL
jgi:hypothetical protein